MDAELKNQVAVITGASQGIGQACAVAFAHAGADVAFTYGQNHEAAEHTAALVRDAVALTRPPLRGASWTITARPVFFTDRAMVSTSTG